MKDQIYKLTTQKKTLVSFLFCIITIVFLSQLLHFKINATPYILEPSHPSRSAENEIHELFSHTEQSVLMLVETIHNDIFNASTIEFIHKTITEIELLSLVDEKDETALSKFVSDDKSRKLVNSILLDGLKPSDYDEVIALKKYLLNNEVIADGARTQNLEGLQDIIVNLKPIRSIVSILNSDDVRVEGEDLIIESLIDYPVEEGFDFRRTKERALENPMFVNLLLGEGAKTTSVRVDFNINDNDDERLGKIVGKISDIVKRPNTEHSISIAGSPVVLTEISKLMMRDNILLTPLVSTVIALILFVSFRSWVNVLIPLTITTITVIWTVSIMTIFKIEMNIISLSLPVVLTTIAVADSVHFITLFEKHLNSGIDLRESLRLTHQALFRPLLLTSLTTCGGFFAVAYSEFSFVQYFGVFAGVGVLIAFLLTVFVLPILLAKFYVEPKIDNPANQTNKLNEMLSRFIQTTIKSRYVSLTVFILFTVIMLSAAINVKVDSSNVKSLSSAEEFSDDLETINQNIGGTFFADIWFSSTNENAFKRPEMIEAMRDIKTILMENEEVGYVISPADFVDYMHKTMQEGSTKSAPQLTQELISQYYFLYEGSQNRELEDVLSTFDYQDARMIVVAKSDLSSYWYQLRDKTRAYAKEILPEGTVIKFSGFGSIVANFNELITNSQLTSIFIGFVVVTTLMILMFKSLIIGIISSVPLLFTIIGNFAFMTVFNIPVDVGNVIASVLVLAVGVDFSIHFIAAVQNSLSVSTSLEEATSHAISEIARPILINALSLALGFLVLLASSYQPIQILGLLMGLSMIICAITTLLVLPFLLVLVKPKTLTSSFSQSRIGVL